MRRWKVNIYCDASWGNLPDGVSSAQSHIILLKGWEQRCCPIAWVSRKVKRHVPSTLVLRDALDEAIYLASIMTELYCNNYRVNELPVVAYTDNKLLHENLHSTKQVREKRLRIDMAEIRRTLNTDDIHRIIWLPTELQLANALTKRGAS